MKIRPSIALLAVGIALTVTTSWAQTTPTGAATSTTYPQGAITTDSMSTGKASRQQKRAMRHAKRMSNQNTSKTGTTVQNARYRESSASDGTSINNSNTTNYNSNNVTNAPTGVGSNPNTIGVMSTTTNSTNSSSTPSKP